MKKPKTLKINDICFNITNLDINQNLGLAPWQYKPKDIDMTATTSIKNFKKVHDWFTECTHEIAIQYKRNGKGNGVIYYGVFPKELNYNFDEFEAGCDLFEVNFSIDYVEFYDNSIELLKEERKEKLKKLNLFNTNAKCKAKRRVK